MSLWRSAVAGGLCARWLRARPALRCLARARFQGSVGPTDPSSGCAELGPSSRDPCSWLHASGPDWCRHRIGARWFLNLRLADRSVGPRADSSGPCTCAGLFSGVPPGSSPLLRTGRGLSCLAGSARGCVVGQFGSRPQCPCPAGIGRHLGSCAVLAVGRVSWGWWPRFCCTDGRVAVWLGCLGRVVCARFLGAACGALALGYGPPSSAYMAGPQLLSYGNGPGRWSSRCAFRCARRKSRWP
jgi:hypothetical protein